MIPGMAGELGTFGSPLQDLSALVIGRDATLDLVDEDVVEAVTRAIETGTTWGAIAEALRGESSGTPQPGTATPSVRFPSVVAVT